MLLYTLHLIQLFHHQQNIKKLNDEQYYLEMLYQKTISSLHQEKSPPPYHYNFPDGHVSVTLFTEESNREIYQLEIVTNKGSSRTINTEFME